MTHIDQRSKFDDFSDRSIFQSCYCFGSAHAQSDPGGRPAEQESYAAANGIRQRDLPPLGPGGSLTAAMFLHPMVVAMAPYRHKDEGKSQTKYIPSSAGRRKSYGLNGKKSRIPCAGGLLATTYDAHSSEELRPVDEIYPPEQVLICNKRPGCSAVSKSAESLRISAAMARKRLV